MLPWIVILLARGFIVSCPTTWSLALSLRTGKETGNVAPSPLIGFCLIWKRGSPSPSHPHTLLLWGPFTLCPGEESFPSQSCE